MTTQIVKMVIQLRRDTAENWELYKDIVPAAGEPCFVTDKNILKIGDGVTTFEKLEPIGGANIEVSADGKSIVLEDGVFKLMGFDAAEVGAQPRKTADGSIEWVMPADVTKLEADVESLKSDVSDLKTNVTTLQEIVIPSGDNATPLLSRVETLEEKMDGTGEGSVDAKVDAKINEFANKISDDGIVNTLKELVDYVANHGGEIDTVVADIIDLKQRVGDDPVRDQIDYAISTSGHITKEEAESTFIKGIKVNGTLIDIVEGIVDINIAEQTLGVKGSDEIDVAEDGTLTIKSISFNKIVQSEDFVLVMDGGSAG